MTWVKICGTTNLEDALTAVDAGADAVGFVFYEKSPRNISVEAAKKIVAKLPESVEKIGVFVNETPERVSVIADEVRLTAIQFHGDEHLKPEKFTIDRRSFFCIPADWVEMTWRKNGNALESFTRFPDNLGAIVVDSGTREKRGGTGKAFDWESVRPWASAMSKLNFPIAIAGGLTPANVGEALGILDPWGVDVVSGVEARPGKKDPEKVRAFVRAVREIEQQAS